MFTCIITPFRMTCTNSGQPFHLGNYGPERTERQEWIIIVPFLLTQIFVNRHCHSANSDVCCFLFNIMSTHTHPTAHQGSTMKQQISLSQKRRERGANLRDKQPHQLMSRTEPHPLGRSGKGQRVRQQLENKRERERERKQKLLCQRSRRRKKRK